MAAKKRASATTETTSKPDPEKSKPGSPPTDPPIRPAKYLTILKFSLVFSIPYLYLIFSHYRIDYELKRSILISAFVSSLGFFVTVKLIPVASKYVSRSNLIGYDINKKGTPDGSIKVPESLGIVVGIVFLVVTILFQYFNFTADSNWLVEYNAALVSICFMILLGFVDDVLDVPWREIGVAIGCCSSVVDGLCGAYEYNYTKAARSLCGTRDFRFRAVAMRYWWIYKLYMGLLAVFCTNSINIHAGINGLEVGQTVVIACAILIHNIMQIGTYPSSVFVGDTYTYFAGMTMVVAGILGHFSETLLIFFAPQVLNFLLSLPQLAGIVPCPRHRLPRFDPVSGLLTGTNDGTLVNLFLRQFGRRSEKSLCILLLVFQLPHAADSVFCFGGYLLGGTNDGWTNGYRLVEEYMLCLVMGFDS
ncbi:hypothetical protein OROMI_024556 [Orobanche minor]